MNNQAPQRAARIPVLVDGAMVVALLSLTYWIGVEANKVDTVSRDVQMLRTEVASMQSSSTSADIASLRQRADGQDRAMSDMRDFIGQRLDRIERKLDSRR